MSHANGQIIKDGKVIGHFEYNGTVDVAISHIYDTYEEMDENWRKGKWLNCSCGNQPETVILWTDYGNGFYWEGLVCLSCKSIETCDPYHEMDKNPYGSINFPIDGYPLDCEPYSERSEQ